MKKLLCPLLTVVVIISTIPLVSLADWEKNLDEDDTAMISMDNEEFVELEDENDEAPDIIALELVHDASTVNIHIDWDLNVLVDPHIESNITFYDTGYIGIWLPIILDPELIILTLPRDDWTYEITHEGADEYRVNEGDPEIGTLVMITVCWNTFFGEEEEGNMGYFVPSSDRERIINAPFEIWATNVNSQASLLSGLTGGTGNRVLRVTQTFNQTGTINIATNRSFIIASDGTNLTDNTRDGEPFTIIRNSNGRHFVVQSGTTLTLSQIILDSGIDQVTTTRGGVEVRANGHLMIENGGTISRSRVLNRGGGVMVTSGRLTMNGGSIIRNHAQDNTPAGQVGWENGGGGVHLDGNSNFVMNGGVISNNTTAHMPSSIWQGGGGIFVGGTSTFTMNGGVISGNTASLEGGGINIGRNAQATMFGGSIMGNTAESTGRGGGGVWVSGGSFTTANRSNDNVTEKIISFNKTRGHGGGIGVVKVAESFIGGSGVVTLVEGTIIEGNEAGVEGGFLSGGGLGGGILLLGEASLDMKGGKIINNYSMRHGGGIVVWNQSTLTFSGGEIRGNRTDADGGGIFLNINNNRLTMSGGAIKNNTANGNGGGIIVTGNTSVFDAQAGAISNNLANAGGALFVEHSNLDNITIDEEVEFTDNVARLGIRIDSPLAEQNPQVGPGTVSLTGSIIEDIPTGSGNFKEIPPHSFTNYDINTQGRWFWNVTYEIGEGKGDVVAKTSIEGFVIPSKSYVPDGTNIIFGAEPIHLFSRWDVGTRTKEMDEDRSIIPFDFIVDGNNTSLFRNITAHTYIIGHFEEVSTLMISKEVTGQFGNRVMEFEFTITIQDSKGNPLPVGTPIHYTGSTMVESGGVAPPNGTLTLDNNGSAIFHLMHGQAIHFEDIPLSGNIRIVETLDRDYWPSFIDSEDINVIVCRNDTTFLPMAEERTFRFINERDIVPQTGVNDDNIGVILLLLILLLPSLMGLAISRAYRHSKQMNVVVHLP